MARMRRRSKYGYRRRRAGNRGLVALLPKTVAGALGIALLSLLFVFCHDVVTQSPYFALREIRVDGADRIGREQVLHHAGLHPGMNLLSVNLSLVRKRLLAHPWVSEAAIRRVIPSGLRISIREHQPLAILDLGRRFLIDDNGKIFKELDRSDPQDLPTVSGLTYSDLDLDPSPRLPAFRPSEAVAATAFDSRRRHSSIYKSAVSLLLLVHRQSAAGSTQRIRSVRADREIGVTLHTFDRNQTIQMGFGDYARKLDVLESILAFTGDPDAWRQGEIESIDLKNPDRVVVHPNRKKEV